ncbi:MAG: septal ring lytic transglycosylase RlpA family protein [Bacteroides sp.]
MFRTTIATLLLTLLVWGGGVVLAQNKSFSQEGQASYYADKFHGRSTASGEKYDKTLFTCAHMTLPYGTNLKVTNLDNGKKVVVRVNDRGPFSPNRIIDVSRAAAEALDMIAKGVAKVRIEITSETPSDPVPVAESEKKTADTQKSDAAQGITEYKPNSQPLDSKPQPKIQLDLANDTPQPAKTDLFSVQVNKKSATGFAVQLASFNGVGNLLSRLAEFDTSVKSDLHILAVEKDGVTSYKILYGIYATRPEADKAKESLVAKYPDCFIISL